LEKRPAAVLPGQTSQAEHLLKLSQNKCGQLQSFCTAVCTTSAELLLYGDADDDDGSLQPLNLTAMMDDGTSAATLSKAAIAAVGKAAAGGGSLHWSGAVQLVAFCLFEVLIGESGRATSNAAAAAC